MIVFLLLLLSAKPAFANADSTFAETLVLQAVRCAAESKDDSAALYHNQALHLFEKQDLLAPWLNSYMRMGYAWALYRKEPFRGIEYIQAGRQKCPRQPRNELEWDRYCHLHMACGFICRKVLKDFNLAKYHYQEALQIFLGPLQEHHDEIAQYLYHNLGNIYTRLGDYDRAYNLFQRSLAYLKQWPDSGVYDHSDFSIVLQEMKKPQEALQIVREGLAYKNAPSDVLICLRINESDLLREMGDFKSAMQANAQIPRLLPKLKKEGNSDEGYYHILYLRGRAEILASQKQYTAAAASFRQAIREGLIEYEGNQSRELGKIYISLGNLALEQKQYALALSEYHAALSSVLPDFQIPDPNALPDPAGYYSENTILEALEGKAIAFRALGQPDKALACYELIPAVESKLIATHAYESSSLLTVSESRSRIDAALDIAWQRYRESGERQYADRAFHLTEQARGLLLLQSLTEAQAQFQLPDSLQRQEDELNGRINWLEQEISLEQEKGAEADSARLQSLQNELFQLKQKQERFRERLRRQYADYARLTDQIRFLTAGEVPALLRPEQALLDYYLTDTDAYVFLFASSGLISWRKTALPADFRNEVLRFASYLSAMNESAGERSWFLQKASIWYDSLMGPELRAAKFQSLVIVPDDALVFLPLEVLLRQPVEGPWPDMPYLLKDFSIAYAYSCTLLQTQQAITRSRTATRRQLFAGFAPSYKAPPPTNDAKQIAMLTRDGQYDLKGTHEELRNIHNMVGGDKFDGAAADEATFKRIAAKYRILLLSMHAIADESNPNLSHLLFGDKTANGSDDNVLYANELQIMRLQADLAVLSACHTGFGKLHKGEGVYSLARAFAAAGVPATVMSLWRLPDQTAPALMKAFFRNLQKGLCKDEALRQAKLEFLADEDNYDNTHPHFWAGVVANGDMCLLDLGTPQKAWALYGAVAAVLFLCGWLLGRRRNRKRAA